MDEKIVETKTPEKKVEVTEHKSTHSDIRMRNLAKLVQGVEPNQSSKKVVKDTPEVLATSSEDKAKAESKPAEPKVDDATKVVVKPEEKPKVVEKEPHFAPDSKDYWKHKATTFQSKFDTREQEVTKTIAEKEAKLVEVESKVAKLEERAKLVDKFESDPLSVIQNYLPEIQEKLALQNGQPIDFIEQKVSQTKKFLDRKFTQELGEDWRYNDYEALQPGTPSFRYKLALEESRESAKNNFKEYVGKQKEAIANQQKQIETDKVKLQTEFGLTDEDFKVVEKFASENTWSLYNVAKLALFDKILNDKISKASILAPQKPQADISDSPGLRGVTKAKVEISPGAKKMASRLGSGAFRQ